MLNLVSVVFLLTFSFFALLFIFFPRLDIIFSSFFFDGASFFLADNLTFFYIDKFAYFTYGILLCISIFLCLNKNRDGVYLLYLSVLGPGIFIQLFTKKFFSRARPENILEFCGKLKFSPAFSISDQCVHNCSFMSFHASVFASCLSYFLFLYRGKAKNLYIKLFFTLLFSFSLLRIAQGKHFLSDVLFSSLCVLFMGCLLSRELVQIRKLR